MAAELLHPMTDAYREAVRPAEARAMTTRARLRRRNRDAGIEIKLFAKCGLLRRVRIILRKGYRRRPPIKRLECVGPGRAPGLYRNLPWFSDQRRAEALACITKTGQSDRGGGKTY